MAPDISSDALDALVHGSHGSPLDLLGAHPEGADHVSIRALRPTARSLTVIDETTHAHYPMNRWRDEGFFEVTIPAEIGALSYHFEAETHEGSTEAFADPYLFPPLLTDFDLYLFSAGTHLDAYQKMGAHPREIKGVTGVNFAVWAPNALRISVVGDFNHWDERVHPMIKRGVSGIWELFIPGIREGAIYRYDVLAINGYNARKIDPYGFASELRPNNASIVADIDHYRWQDSAWMQSRPQRKPLAEAMAIYEVHLGSWRRKEDGTWYSYRELASLLVQYVQRMNYTHIELMPVAEHPLDASWGYQTTGYFAPTSRYGSPTDFMYFVDYCHQHGIGVILDWVPAHFPKDGHALSYFDGTHLYSHADPRQGEHPDWGTYIFNYGRNEVKTFLLSNALFWLKEYHIDGLRVDAVSSMLYLDFSRKEGQWLPNKYGSNENLDAIAFLREFNEIVHRECPGAVTIAEESTAWAMVSRPLYVGGLGFTFKWNMGWMHDTLEYMQKDSVFRRYHHNLITFSIAYAFSENFILSLSHDEVVHLKGSLLTKMSGDWWRKFASLRLLFGYQYTHPGKKLNFMGAEIGQWREWSEERGLDWELLEWSTHQQLQQWMRDLNALYKTQPALYEVDYDWKGFKWIEPNDSEQSVATYIRYAADQEDFLVICCNFTPIPRQHYRVGVPKAGYYKELLNSDSQYYGGGNIGNDGGVQSHQTPAYEFEHSLSLTIPPLSIVILKLATSEEKARSLVSAAASAIAATVST
ncbi:MAG: 1,4-alpha-glucan branching protein GlgB [Anaerolineae bacterium]|nr:1,4-alpha-glucan branching protein GlgB [Anaerolineae bacterium]